MSKRKGSEAADSGIVIFVDEFGTVSTTLSTFRDDVPQSKLDKVPNDLTSTQLRESNMVKVGATLQNIPESTPAGFISFRSNRKVRNVRTSKSVSVSKHQVQNENALKKAPVTISIVVDRGGISDHFVVCPTCGALLRPKNTGRHQRKVHGVGSAKPTMPKERRVGRSKQDRRTAIESKISVKQNRQNDAFEQDYYETRFGEKHLGQMRRESNGRFGSIPLHDNYDEESTAD